VNRLDTSLLGLGQKPSSVLALKKIQIASEDAEAELILRSGTYTSAVS